MRSWIPQHITEFSTGFVVGSTSLHPLAFSSLACSCSVAWWYAAPRREVHPPFFRACVTSNLPVANSGFFWERHFVGSNIVSTAYLYISVLGVLTAWRSMLLAINGPVQSCSTGEKELSTLLFGFHQITSAQVIYTAFATMSCRVCCKAGSPLVPFQFDNVVTLLPSGMSTSFTFGTLFQTVNHSTALDFWSTSSGFWHMFTVSFSSQ